MRPAPRWTPERDRAVTRRTTVILAVILTGIALGIFQGLPDTIPAVADVLGLN